MEKGNDYIIKKLEKGPLQRFKNQNLLLKKFGEMGIKVYKTIMGKRTADELCRDLEMEEGMFKSIIGYMEEAGMVSLEPAGAGKKGVAREEEEAPPEEEPAPAEEPEAEPKGPEPEPEEPVEEEVPAEEELKPEFEEEKEEIAEFESEPEEEGITPEFEEGQPGEEPEEERPKPTRRGAAKPQRQKMKKPVEEEIVPEEEAEPEEPEAEQEGFEPEPESEEPTGEEEPVGEELIPEFEEEKGEAAGPEEEVGSIEEEQLQSEGEAGVGEGEGLSPVEKIISDKYGDIGLRVYTLIDGARTAEEIMSETGLDESKLVEILEFMDAQGIIKLDYPGGAKSAGIGAAKPEKEPIDETFSPMVEGGECVGQITVKDLSPVEVPVKAPVGIVKEVQIKAKTLLKFSDAGSKVYECIDGKNDIIDIFLKVDAQLYTIAEIFQFLLENGGVLLKPMPRAEIKKKYGDDGYSVYKKYGKEGLALYELIGKDMSLKQMAERVVKNKEQVADMFIFIHQVLGIELPIDKEVLKKQLGV